MIVLSRSPAETLDLGRRLGERCRGGETFALVGDLGFGKTVFAKGLAAGLGVDPDAVASPTFLGLALHRGRLLFAHADAYRIDDADAFIREGWDDLEGAVRLVEWADRVPAMIPPEATWVSFALAQENVRRIEIAGGVVSP